MLHVAQTAAYSIRVEQEKIIKLLSQFGRLQFHKDLGSFPSSYAKSSTSHEDLARIIPNKEMLCRSLGRQNQQATAPAASATTLLVNLPAFFLQIRV